MKQRVFATAMIFLALMFVVFGAITVMAPQQAEAQYSVNCYREQGGAKSVAGSGCEYEFQSGSTLDVQSGTDVTFGAVVTISAGGINVTGDSTINGALDMSNNAISNIGAAGTDFGSDGSLTTAQTVTVSAGGVAVTGDSTINGALDMSNNAISNIGAAGTDFGSDGSLTTAQTVTVSAGGVAVTGDSSINGALDMSNNAISNIGAAGTDFGSDGSLTTAQTVTVSAGGITATGDSTINGSLTTADTITVTSGGLDVAGASDIDGALTVLTFTVTYGGVDVQSGDITMENDETFSNSENGTITVTVASGGRFAVAAGNLTVGSGTPDLTLNGGDAYVAGTLEADGAARLDGGATVAGDLEISNGLFLPMFDDLTINDGDWLTVTTVSVYALDSSSEVTMTLGACSNDGQPLELIGDDNNTININATNLRTTDGNALTLGQYDDIGLRCQDTEWILRYESDNQ